jgi:ribosomal 50S subunit-recycling heat shock protein
VKARKSRRKNSTMKKMTRRLSVLFIAFVMVAGMIAPAASFADTKSDDYVYGTVNMNYADFYYGELNGIEPSDATAIDTRTSDPVTEAGYREEGFYDAATFATPRGFIYENKWETWPGTYSEPIYDDWGNKIGGKILGVKAVNVAVKKSVYDAAIKAPKSNVGKKAAKIELNADQSQVPLSYKVLNPDGVYSKYVNLTDSVEVALDGECTTAYMGDDIWWEGRAMRHTKDQTILGGVIEYKKDPLDATEKPVVLGLKHNENMYNDEWIGWGMGPGNVGIYGGNETGWQRFSGISGKYLTKMSYIIMEQDGSVHYYNATYNAEADTDKSQMNKLLNPLIPSGIVENGQHPYGGVQISNYEFTKDRVKIDFSLDVPVRADGTPEADYYLNSINAPGRSLPFVESKNSRTGVITYPVQDEHPEIVPVYQESEWVNGHKTIHIEINRRYKEGDTDKYIGTGRYKYWFYVKKSSIAEGDRAFSTIAAWKMLYTDETPDQIYLKGNKLYVNSDTFNVADYIENPYEQIEIYDPATGELVDLFATGDANTSTTLFLGTKKQDGTPVKGLFSEDGSINFDAASYSYNRRTGEEKVTPIFPDENGKYDVVLYSGGFPIVSGSVSKSRVDPTITCKDSFSKKFGDKAFSLGATASTGLKYQSSDTKVAVVSADGKVTIKGVGTAKITVTAKESADYNEAVKTVTVEVAKGTPTISAKTSFAVKASKLQKKAQVVDIKAKASSGGKITCTKKSGKASFKVAKGGKITIKKGTKKGTYRVKVQIKCAAKGNYTAAAKKVTVKIKVK